MVEMMMMNRVIKEKSQPPTWYKNNNFSRFNTSCEYVVVFCLSGGFKFPEFVAEAGYFCYHHFLRRCCMGNGICLISTSTTRTTTRAKSKAFLNEWIVYYQLNPRAQTGKIVVKSNKEIHFEEESLCM